MIVETVAHRLVVPVRLGDPIPTATDGAATMYERRVRMPIVFIDAPPGIRADAKRTMMEKITAAIDEAYHIGDTLVFLREHAIENVAMDGRIQSENPKILEALAKISGS